MTSRSSFKEGYERIYKSTKISEPFAGILGFLLTFVGGCIYCELASVEPGIPQLLLFPVSGVFLGVALAAHIGSKRLERFVASFYESYGVRDSYGRSSNFDEWAKFRSSFVSSTFLAEVEGVGKRRVYSAFEDFEPKVFYLQDDGDKVRLELLTERSTQPQGADSTPN